MSIPCLMDAGLSWTISDETVLARSLSGAAPRQRLRPAGAGPPRLGPMVSTTPPTGSSARPGSIAIVFRDHTLSDLIGFAYRSWDSRDAAADLLRRLRDLRAALARPAATPAASPRTEVAPLVTIALDGENAWEYYPHDGGTSFSISTRGSAPTSRCAA